MNTENLRVVIIAHAFPPQPRAGAARPWRQAELLGRRGHDVTVITAAPEPAAGSYRAITIPYRSVGHRVRAWLGGGSSEALADDLRGHAGMSRRFAKRLVRIAKGGIVWLDGGIVWGLRSGMRARSLARGQKIDLLVTSSPPFSVHIAGLLARSRVRTWVMDYRDLFTVAAYPASHGLKLSLERWFERRCLGRSDAVFVTCPGNDDAIRRLREGIHAQCVPTGIWRTLGGSVAEQPLADQHELRILYTGVLYQGLRDVGTMLSALRIINDQLRDVGMFAKVVFMGPYSHEAERIAESEGVRDAVEFVGRVPSDVARASQERASILLLVGFAGFTEQTEAIPQKLWEYMETGRPIVATGFPAEGAVARLLHAYGRALLSDDADRIATEVLAYAEGRRGALQAGGPDDKRQMTGEPVPTSADMASALERAAAEGSGD